MKTKFDKFVKWWNSWTGTFVVVFFVIFFIAQAFMIPSSSMVNTMLIGDGLFGKKFSYGMPIPRIPYLEIPILPKNTSCKLGKLTAISVKCVAPLIAPSLGILVS
jgi:signal peptidase I